MFVLTTNHILVLLSFVASFKHFDSNLFIFFESFVYYDRRFIVERKATTS